MARPTSNKPQPEACPGVKEKIRRGLRVLCPVRCGKARNTKAAGKATSAITDFMRPCASILRHIILFFCKLASTHELRAEGRMDGSLIYLPAMAAKHGEGW